MGVERITSFATSNEERLSIRDILIFSLIIFDLLLGDVPRISFAMYALLFYSWQRERVEKEEKRLAEKMKRKSDEWTITLVVLLCLVGYVVSLGLQYPSVSLLELSIYGFSTIVCIRGLTLIYAMHQQQHDLKPILPLRKDGFDLGRGSSQDELFFYIDAAIDEETAEADQQSDVDAHHERGEKRPDQNRRA